tara:strand:+ start:39 stop:467 length:429 start_codon:yes stop_codon:yes gene_type:complete
MDIKAKAVEAEVTITVAKEWAKTREQTIFFDDLMDRADIDVSLTNRPGEFGRLQEVFEDRCEVVIQRRLAQNEIQRRDRLTHCIVAIRDWGVVNITGQPGDVVESLVRLGYTVTTQPYLRYEEAKPVWDVFYVARETVTQSN